MNRKHMMSISVVSIAIAGCVIAVVSASVSESSTPLYMYRMEQMSNKMNFLPTEMNDFAYTAEEGYILSYDISGYGAGGAVPAGDISWGILTCNTCNISCSGCTYGNENC
ncbi:MAG: hypothetical protein HXS48_10710 [Theionarchaea archaeon]|nr:MAG: hypothetical protein AYK19_04695 [Theionarchaea archaeon DG-70-1]MBU7027396.1 hypothetical protein [Theionarchaea archaeon]